MRVLFLGDVNSPLAAWLRQAGEDVLAREEKLTPEEIRGLHPDIIVSYNYRHILPAEALSRPRFGAVNLHISYLPWNRGADPNLWSHIEGTPKGVTIHYMDAGVDTGDIIAQKETAFGSDETLRGSYDKLHAEIQALFKEWWPKIRTGSCPRLKQAGEGSFHLK